MTPDGNASITIHSLEGHLPFVLHKLRDCPRRPRHRTNTERGSSLQCQVLPWWLVLIYVAYIYRVMSLPSVGTQLVWLLRDTLNVGLNMVNSYVSVLWPLLDEGKPLVEGVQNLEMDLRYRRTVFRTPLLCKKMANLSLWCWWALTFGPYPWILVKYLSIFAKLPSLSCYI